tara:strand:+ start:486 stop:1406 length:921 start_codon:yes stop_codon:yes gene_type:complete
MGFGGLFANDNTQHQGFSQAQSFTGNNVEGLFYAVVKQYIGKVDDVDMTGGIVCSIQNGPHQSDREINAYPANPTSFTIPVQNESVLVYYNKEANSAFYFGPVNDTSDIGFALNAKGTVKMDGEVEEDVSLYTFPKRNIFPGETLLQSRYGGSIRFGANVGYDNEWSLDGEEGKPIIVIRTGDDTVPTIEEDTAQIVLLSDQSYPSRAKAPMDYERPDQYLGSQVIIESGRLVFHSEEENLILSGQELSLSTSSWSVDFGILMDQLEALVQAIMAMTHPTGVGPSGPPINVADFSKIMTEIAKMKQ